MGTSGVYFDDLETFLLSVKHSHRHFSQHIDYSELENILKSNRYFCARNMLTCNNADVTHCEKNLMFYIQNNVVYRAERLASRYMF